MQITAEIDHAFDGQAKFIYGILHKSAKINTVLGLEPEDLMQEFYFYYTKHRHKFDPSRSSRTRFTYWMVRSFLYSLRRRLGRHPALLQKDINIVEQSRLTLDRDETELVNSIQSQNKITIKTLAKRVKRPVAAVKEDVESIRQKVYRKRNKIVLVSN
jgi:hypothetical protein